MNREVESPRPPLLFNTPWFWAGIGLCGGWLFMSILFERLS